MPQLWSSAEFDEYDDDGNLIEEDDWEEEGWDDEDDWDDDEDGLSNEDLGLCPHGAEQDECDEPDCMGGPEGWEKEDDLF